MNERWRSWKIVVELLFGRDDAGISRRLENHVAERPSRWTQLVSIANEQLVTAPLWSALQRSRTALTATPDVADYLQSFHEFNAARNRAVVAQLDEFVGALNSQSVEPLLLKGAAYLASGLLPDLGDRYLSDLDLLVPAEAVDRARDVLQSLGYRPASEIDYSLHHHLVPMVREDRVVAIELHRAPVPIFARDAISTEQLWHRSQACRIGTRRARLPSPTDGAMLSFVHSQIVDRDGALLLLPLRLFDDLRRLQLRYGQEIDWQENLARARGAGAEASMRRFLHALRALTGIDVSGEAGVSLGDRLHYVLCEANVTWPAIGVFAQRAVYSSQRGVARRRQRA